MLGIICEKPSQAQNFATALGGRKGIYNGEPYIVAAMHGHLYEFKDPSDMVPPELKERYRVWNLATLPWNAADFDWSYRKRDPKDNTAESIKKSFDAAGVTEIVIATDFDPTGEGGLLASELIQMQHLDVGRKLSRMYFSDEAPVSIQTAFKTRKLIQSIETFDEYRKAFYRSRWDFLSMQFTRVATKLGDGRSVLRNGRLKSFATYKVGEQLAARAAYKKVIRYQRRFRDENGVLYTDSKQPVVDHENELSGEFHASAVVCDKREMRRQGPPKLVDLAQLSSILSTKGLKPKQVLDIYQKMYQYNGNAGYVDPKSAGRAAGFTSYPRTEDRAVTPAQYQELLPIIDRIAAVVGVDSAILTHRAPRKTHVANGMAHGANRPGLRVPESLEWLDREFGRGAGLIYETLAKSYLAMLAEDYEYERQSGHVRDYPTFVGAVNVPTKVGYKAVFSAVDDEDEDANERGLGTTASPIAYEVIPPKPAQPTVKWLVKQFERADVGSGATRTSVIAEITDTRAKYPLMTESRGKLGLTRFGEMNYRLLPGTHIASLDLTSRVLKQMDEVAAGTYDPEGGLAAVADMVIDDMAIMHKNSAAMRDALGVTPIGDAEYVETTFEGKSVRFKRVWSGYRFTDDEVARLIAGETISFMATKRDGKGTYTATGKLGWLKYKGRDFFGFQLDTSGWGGGEKEDSDEPPVEWNGHIFTAREIDILKQGYPVIADFTWASGRTSTCAVAWTKPRGKKTKQLVPEFAKTGYPKKFPCA